MTIADHEALVVEVACLIEDRDDQEQRAMIAVALRLDQDRGAFVHDGRDAWTRPHLVDLVLDTWRPEPPYGRAKLTKQQASHYDRIVERWSLCVRCHLPWGAHYADDACPLRDGVPSDRLLLGFDYVIPEVDA